MVLSLLLDIFRLLQHDIHGIPWAHSACHHHPKATFCISLYQPLYMAVHLSPWKTHVPPPKTLSYPAHVLHRYAGMHPEALPIYCICAQADIPGWNRKNVNRAWFLHFSSYAATAAEKQKGAVMASSWFWHQCLSQFMMFCFTNRTSSFLPTKTLYKHYSC